jgi:multiple sugar transport system substrate-binding protein
MAMSWRLMISVGLALILAPLGAQGADLVVWWEKGFNPEEDAAVKDTLAAFEQKSGKRVELVFHSNEELPNAIEAALKTGQPPDFTYGMRLVNYLPEWAFEGRLIDLSDAILPFANLFDPSGLAFVSLFDATAGRRGVYALPMGFEANHVHVWRSLLEKAGFGLNDIPKEWEAFWTFWCDRVQPAVRRATGRDDIYGVGLAMSAEAADTTDQFIQFMQAYQADYVTRQGKLIIDDPDIRRRLIRTMEAYTAIYREGCTPPDSIGWGTSSSNNNQAFLAGAVVMTPNATLSIPAALKRERPDDYYKNAATIDWPKGADGQPLAIRTGFDAAVAFKASLHVPLAEQFVRFLVEDGWLAHYLDFSGERLLPSLSKLLDQPFWLDPKDPHHMASAVQFLTLPRADLYPVVSGNPRHMLVEQENVWAKAVHRVAAEGVSPEQAVDEAIARIKQILAE